MAGLAEQAYACGEILPSEMAHDDLPFDLLDALAVESDPRAPPDVVSRLGASHSCRQDAAEPPL